MATRAIPFAAPAAKYPLHPLFGRMTRDQIEQLIEAAIAFCDEQDGDTDLEDDDPAGDPLDSGEDEDWRPEGIRLLKPVYGTDQSLGPINEDETFRDFKCKQLGISRSDRGGWQRTAGRF